MSYVASGSIQIGPQGLVLENCTVFCGSSAHAIEFGLTDQAHIGSLHMRYPTKPLHERFADFKARLRAAMDRHGL